MGYFRFFKNYLFKILPISDNCLQDFSKIFYWYVYIKPFPHLLEILMALNCIYWQTEESQTGVCGFHGDPTFLSYILPEIIVLNTCASLK